MTEIERLAIELHRAREEEHASKDRLTSCFDRIMAQHAGEYLPRKEAAESARDTAQKMEEVMRSAAVAEAKRTGQRIVGPGIEVKRVTRWEYDPAVALEWAKEHKIALELDVRALEGVLPTVRPSWAKEEVWPKTYIARDLGPALVKAGLLPAAHEAHNA